MEHTVEARVGRILKRKQFTFSDIKYITHAAQSSYFHLLDGREIKSSMPLKDIFAALPQDQFWNIQKGIVVGVRHTLSIDVSTGVYTMTDGTQFQGRSRTQAEHKRRRMQLRSPLEQHPSAEDPLGQILDKCTLLEDAPIAFCVIELIFAPDGHSIDFVFRYCNQEMEKLERKPISEMVGRSFYAVFPNGDRTWIVPYSDVAINGTKRIIRKYNPEIGCDLIIRCFQPYPGFCACILTEAEDQQTPSVV